MKTKRDAKTLTKVKKKFDPIQTRRDLHQMPELGFQEYKTSKYIRERLDEIGVEYKTYKTGTVAYIDTGVKGPFVVIRGDIDGLPVTEENAVEYKSKIEGYMHACGHDVHPTLVLHSLIEVKALVEKGIIKRGKIGFLFQPGEEGYLGAAGMSKSGLLDGADAIVGAHIWPGLKSGLVNILGNDGSNIATMAGGVLLKIRIKGVSAHAAAAPELGRDPIVAAAQLINTMQTIVSKSISPLNGAVLHVGDVKVKGGALNVVATEVEILGTFRWVKDEDYDVIEKRINQMIKGVALANDLEIEWVKETPIEKAVYPPMITDQKVSEILFDSAKRAMGPSNAIYSTKPLTFGGEDHTFYRKIAPISFFLLGVTKDKETNFPLHSSKMQIDESAIQLGIDVFVQFIQDFLSK